MKVYINLKSLTIIKVAREKPFYQGSNFVDKIRILFDEMLDGTIAPTLTFRLPTGRRKGPIYAIGLDAGSTRLITEESKSWYYYDFILSAETGVLTYPGQLEASITLNYFNVGGAITKQAVTGTIVNEIVKTTVYENGNIIILGDNPEEIIEDFNSAISTIASRQTSLETGQAAINTRQTKIEAVIKNNLIEGNARIEFFDDSIKIIQNDKVIALISSLGLEFIDKISAKYFNAVSPTIPSTFYLVEADDVKVGSAKESVMTNIQSLKTLLNVIKNSLSPNNTDSTIEFTSSAIIVRHAGEEVVKFSKIEGLKCILDAVFNENINVKGYALFEKDVEILRNISATGKDTLAQFFNCCVDGTLEVHGYNILSLIQDRYTKEEVNQLVNQIPKLKKEKVSVLPTTDIDENTIYLVPNGSDNGQSSDYFTEYLYINGDWEILGTTKIDVSNYYTKTDVNGLMANKANADDVYTKTETNNLLDAKANTTDVYSKSEVYTKDEANNILNAKANVADVYTKNETNNLLDAKANTTDVYSKVETDNLLTNKANADYVYTKDETNDLLAAKANASDVYTKTNVYTKSEVNELINQIPKLKKKVVFELPTTDIDENTIYLVPAGVGGSDDYFNEYMYIKDDPNTGRFELLGNSKIVLADYYTKSEIDTFNGATLKLGRNTVNTADSTDTSKYFRFDIVDSANNNTNVSYRVLTTGISGSIGYLADDDTSRNSSAGLSKTNAYMRYTLLGNGSIVSEIEVTESQAIIQVKNDTHISFVKVTPSQITIQTQYIGEDARVPNQVTVDIGVLGININQYDGNSDPITPNISLGSYSAMTTQDIEFTDTELDEIITGAWV